MPVQGLTSGVTDIAADAHQVCAIVNGGVLCWGDLAESLVPVQVATLTSGVTEVAAGNNRTCGLMNGAAYCWGGYLRDTVTHELNLPARIWFP